MYICTSYKTNTNRYENRRDKKKERENVEGCKDAPKKTFKNARKQDKGI